MLLSTNELEALIKTKQMLRKAATPVPFFLEWVRDRLVHVHKDDPDVDFVLALGERARQLQEIAVLLDEDRKP